MEVVFLIEEKNIQRVKDILLKDDVISRASIVFKEAKGLTNKEGFYCYISGLEEQCKRALEKVKVKSKGGEEIELAKEVLGEEKKEVIGKIKEEEERAMESFGGIFQ
jgi:hypothetical protein